mgnify:CR=1 FL=1
MASKSRYFSSYPTINRGYLSGATGRQELKTYDFQDIVYPTLNSRSSNVIVVPNIIENVFADTNINGGTDLKPIVTDNFNVIRLSVDTNFPHINIEDRQLFVDILQGHNEDDMAISYTTPIDTFQTFFRSYPVKNKYVNIQFRNNTSSNIHLDYEVSLSKFSQFTPPSQIGDIVEFKEMTNLTRLANEFYDDVSREQFANSNIINTFGFFKTNVTSKQIVAPVDIQENTSNVFAEVFGVSDSATDAFEINISGQTDVRPTGRINNGINLFGTSNGSISVNRYKYIDTLDMGDNINTGNVSIFRTGTTDLVAFIPKDTGAFSSPIYYIDKLEEGVLKEVRVMGTTILQNGSIEVRLNEGNNIKTIWATNIIDGIQENCWKPDYKLPSNSTCYAIVRDVNTTAHSPQRVDVSMKILRYKNQPENSIAL